MFNRIQNATLSNNFLQLLEGLRRSSAPLVLGILDSPGLPCQSARLVPGYSQLNHLKRDSQVTRSQISYSLIQPLLLPSAPACHYEFHALAVHPHPTLTVPPVRSALQSSQRSVVEPFSGNIQHVKAVGCFCRGTWPLMFDRILTATLSKEKISATGVTQGNLELLPPVSPDSHQTNTIRYKLGLTTHSHFREGELIHWVVKGENV